LYLLIKNIASKQLTELPNNNYQQLGILTAAIGPIEV